MTKPSASDYDLARALMDRIERDGAVHLDSLAAVCMTHRVVERTRKAETFKPVFIGWDMAAIKEKCLEARRLLAATAPPYGLFGEEEVSE